MKHIKTKIGTTKPDEPSDNIKTFILVFMAIIWRRVWITTLIYCKHNNINICKNIVLKSLKFNIFSSAGIGHTLKPYITKALEDGFLMPQYFNQNIYATRAVKLYGPAYKIIKSRSKSEEIKFLKDYTLSILDNDIAEEKKDAMKLVGIEFDNASDNNDTTSDTTSDTEKTFIPIDRCKCKICELIDSWDVNVDLIYSKDPYQNIIMKGLMSVLD